MERVEADVGKLHSELSPARRVSNGREEVGVELGKEES